MSEDLNARLEKLRTASQRASAPAVDTKKRERTATALFGKAATEQNNQTSKQTDVLDTQIYKVLADNSVASESKIDTIAQLITFNFEDPENEKQFQSIEEIKTIISALIDDFTEKQNESIRQIKENPLSELTKSMRAVFDNYNTLMKGREDLKGKLAIIQGFMDKNDGDETALMKALSEAHDKKSKKDELDGVAAKARGELETATTELNGLNDRDTAIGNRLEQIASMGLIARNMPASRAEKAELASERVSVKQKQDAAKSNVQKKMTASEQADAAVTTFVGKDDFAIYDQILQILDIGNKDFADMLSRIADNQLRYNDDTKETLNNVCQQLKKVLEDVRGGQDVSTNTSEKITILLKALNKAQDANASGYQKAKAQPEAPAIAGLENLDGFKHKKILAKAAEFTSETAHCIDSTTLVSGSAETHLTEMQQLRTDLENGLTSASSQLLQAVMTSSASGKAMLNRTQRLAATAQKIVAGSMYAKDLAETFENVVTDFGDQLNAQNQRNKEIGGFSQLISEVTQALDAKNDSQIVLAGEQAALVRQLEENIGKLGQSNKNAAEISTVIAGQDLDKRAKDAPKP